MRSERGQGSVEWIGIVLLVAIALGALARFAPRADGRSLAKTLAGSATHAMRQADRPDPRVVGMRSGKRHDSQPPEREAFAGRPLEPLAGRPLEPLAGRPLEPLAGPPLEPLAEPPLEAFMVPPLVPRPGQAPARLGVPLPEARALLRGARRGAGVAWRRAWLGCLVYERARYGFLHPDSRFPGRVIPRSELLRMANDCISPVDLVRDWPLLTGR
jgi:hypothetical protein